MTSEQLESRKQQDEIVRRKLAVAPLRFEANGKEMMYCYPDSKHDLAGWILYRHPDGRWVTLRKATDQDMDTAYRVLSQDETLKKMPTPAAFLSACGVPKVYRDGTRPE
jgi:hypothetical protein